MRNMGNGLEREQRESRGRRRRRCRQRGCRQTDERTIKDRKKEGGRGLCSLCAHRGLNSEAQNCTTQIRKKADRVPKKKSY